MPESVAMSSSKLLLAACFLTLPLIASADEPRRPPHPPHRPPPEAIEACTNKAEHDACSFTLDDRSIEGTCAKGPEEDKPLACRPAHLPPPPPPR